MSHSATFLFGVGVGFGAAFGAVVGLCVMMDRWKK